MRTPSRGLLRLRPDRHLLPGRAAVYPALDDSDDEHVFKPRGRRRGDEAWNPKARVSVGAGRNIGTGAATADTALDTGVGNLTASVTGSGVI